MKNKIEIPAHLTVDRFGVADNSGDTRSYHSWSAIITSAALMSAFWQYKPANAIVDSRPVPVVIVNKDHLPIVSSPRKTAKFNGGAGNWRHFVPVGVAVA